MGEFAEKLNAMSLERRLFTLGEMPRHLAGAGKLDRFKQTLLNFDFLQAKIGELSAEELISDFDYESDDEALRLVQETLHLSAHILALDTKQLWHQLLGRLMGIDLPAIQALLSKHPQGIWLSPLQSTLTALPLKATDN